MSKRITLSIPDALHRQLDQWRNSFNLSRIFQDALSELIGRKESLRDAVHYDLPQIISRLKREKEETEESWFDEGMKAGLTWAKSAHWLELRQAAEENMEKLLSSGSDISSYLKALLKAEEKKSQLSVSVHEFRTSFLDGWIRGVHDFWGLVQEQIAKA